MLPAAHISHLTKGRMRIKIPSKKGDHNYLLSLEKRFADFEGIKTMKINPVTESLLFIHSSDAGAIAAYALTNDLFILEEKGSFPVGLHQRVSGAFKIIDGGLKSATSGEIDIGGFAFLVPLSFGVYQISVGNIAALPWYAAFWYAMNIFLKSGQGTGSEG